MAYLAHVLLALNLSGPLEPSITWVFANKSCLPCVYHQLDLMNRFYREGDSVLLLLDGMSSSKKTEVEEALRKAFPDAEILKSKKDFHGIRTGWLWWDEHSGEGASYNSAYGGYSPMRSAALLRTLRSPGARP